AERPQRFEDSAHPYIVPAQLFRTRDAHLAVFVTHDDAWRRFAEAAGPPYWLTDPSFATMEGRRLNRGRVLASIQEVLERDDTEVWVRRLTPLGVVVAGVETLEHALASEHVSARDMVIEMSTPHGAIRAVGNPIKIGGATERMTLPPLLDEHGK